MNCPRQRLGRKLFEKRVAREKTYHALKTASARSGIPYPSYSLYKALLKGLFKLFGLYRHCRHQANSLCIQTNYFVLPELPQQLEGFTILHLSDLHLDTNPKLSTQLQKSIQNLEYNIACLTGDFFEHSSRNQGQTTQDMMDILASIQTPKYAVLGNHDSIDVVSFLERQGLPVLLNESIIHQHNNTSIIIAGIDDPHFYRTHNFDTLQVQRNPQIPSILLAHSPEVFFEARRASFDIMLSGHSHGGQLCLPGGIPIINNSRSPRYMISGPWHYKGLQGYTSRGVGCNVLPLRLFCSPEIVIHRLVSAKPSDVQA